MAFKNAVGKITNTFSKVTDSVLNGDLNRVKTVSKLRDEQTAEASSKKQQKEADLAAADKRADLVIDRLYHGYFKDTFDPIQYELELLTNDDDHDQVEAIVERLTLGLEHVSGKLSRHVMTKREQLLQGINTVVSVDYDLKTAIGIAKGTRASLKAAGEEVMSNIRVAGQTRRKQGYMELMEVCNKIKRVTDLQHSLKTAQEGGDYGDAMLMCMQGFQAVDSMKEIKVSAELRATVQRLYVETLQRLDTALTNICSEFRPDAYAKVLEGYLLQSCAGTELAEKVLQCFKDAVHDNSVRVVRSLLLTKPRLIDGLVGGTNSLDGPYSELCRCLPVDLLRPCLLRLCEVMYELLASYHVMATWHAAAVAQQSAKLAEHQQGTSSDTASSTTADGAAASTPAATAAAADAAEEQEVAAVQQVTVGFLAAVSDMLAMSRAEMWEATARRVMELLNIPGLFKAEDFLQVVEWCQKFLGVGEAFVGSASELRRSVDAVCSQFFDVYHHANLATLQTCLQGEQWRNVADATKGAPAIHLESNLRKSPYYVPTLGEPGAPPDFDAWVMAGNPFRRGGKATVGARKQKMLDLLQHPGSLMGFPASTLRLLGRSESQYSLSSMSMSETGAEAREGTADEGTLDCSVPATGDAPETPTPASAHDEDERTSNGLHGVPSEAEIAEPSGRDASTGRSTSSRARMATVTSLLMLKLVKSYVQLMRPLASRATALFHAVTELVDHYLLKAFIVFTGIHLVDLVYTPDIVPRRLFNCLMRILKAKDSPYRVTVLQLEAQKRGEPPSGSFIGRLADKAADRMTAMSDAAENSISRISTKIEERLASTTSQAGSPQRSVSSISHDTTSSGSPRETPDPSSSGQSPQKNITSAGNLFGMKERVVALDSLVHVAEELSGGRAALAGALPSTAVRELDSYFGYTLDAISDLQEVVYRRGVLQILNSVFDPHRGALVQIAQAESDYCSSRAPASHHAWADALVVAFVPLRAVLASSALPNYAECKVWDHAMAVYSDLILEGLSRVRRCSLEGRASMSYDVMHVQRKLRVDAPAGFQVSFTAVDDYIKAFYMPWDEMAKWTQAQLPVYGKQRMLGLIDCVASAFKVKGAAVRELRGAIESAIM